MMNDSGADNTTAAPAFLVEFTEHNITYKLFYALNIKQESQTQICGPQKEKPNGARPHK